MPSRRETIKRVGLAAGALTTLPAWAFQSPTLPPIRDRFRNSPFGESQWTEEELSVLFPVLGSLDPDKGPIPRSGEWYGAVHRPFGDGCTVYSVTALPRAPVGYWTRIPFTDHDLNELLRSLRLFASSTEAEFTQRFKSRMAATDQAEGIG